MAFDIIDPEHTIQSRIGVVGLLVYKALTLLLIIHTVVWLLRTGDNAGLKEFAFFTNWTFELIALTTVLGIGLCF